LKGRDSRILQNVILAKSMTAGHGPQVMMELSSTGAFGILWHVSRTYLKIDFFL